MHIAFDSDISVDDDTLITRFNAGDHAAARLLTMRHAPRILARANRMLRNSAEAEDVTQEAMMRLWKTAATWEPGGAKLSTWLHRVTTNLCIDRMRRAQSVDLEAAPEQIDDRPHAADVLQSADVSRHIANALEKLPDRQRMALTLRFLDDLTNPEIAEMMELSVDAVESLLARGKRSLAAALDAHRDALL